MYQSQQELLKQSIEWMKQHEAELIALYAKAVRSHPKNFFARLDDAALLLFATTNIKGIIARLENIPINSERTEQNLFGFFEQGLTLADLNQVLDTAMDAINKHVLNGFRDKPKAGTVLVEKISYIKQAYSTITSLTMIKFESKKQ